MDPLPTVWEAQYMPVTVPSDPTAIGMVDVALQSYFLTPAGDTRLANRVEI
jgi:hypothetical protein